MSTNEIIREISRLSHRDRREIARQIFEMEEDAQVLDEIDRIAAENFRMLDEMEKADAKDDTR